MSGANILAGGGFVSTTHNNTESNEKIEDLPSSAYTPLQEPGLNVTKKPDELKKKIFK